MDPIIYLAITVAYLVLFIIGLRLIKKYGLFHVENVLMLIILALLYDNAILAYGKLIGEGELLKNLSLLRYWFHAIFTPLLVLFAWKSIVNADIRWAKTIIAKWTAILFYFILVTVELFTVVFGISLESSRDYGVLSYSASSGAVPYMIIGVMVALLIAAIIVAWKQKWFWFLFGVILMWIGAMVTIPIPSDAFTNVFELILLSSLLATKAYQDRQSYNRFLQT